VTNDERAEPTSNRDDEPFVLSALTGCCVGTVTKVVTADRPGRGIELLLEQGVG
jgi:hypothetical protein